MMIENPKKLCIIYNTAPRYREAIFQAIDNEYDCYWYFGETKSDIKEMDLSILKHTQYYKTYGNPSKVCVKRGILRLLFKREYQCYLVLAEVRSITDWIFFWLANTFFPKKKIYIWTHGWYGREKGIDAKLKLWLFHHVAGTFVYGNRAKQLLIDQGVPADKLFEIHNSLQYEEHKRLRECIHRSNFYVKHFNNNYPVIVVIGRLNVRKKLDLLLRSIAKLKLKNKNYNVVFIGDGDDRQILENLTRDLELSNNVWFFGACYDEKQNAELIINADLCVVPGDIGLTAIHVMTFGIPVITHNLYSKQGPEFEVIHDGVTGAFFNYDDIDDLSSKILSWFDQNLDKREQVSLACYNEIDTRWTPSYQIEVLKHNLKF